MLLPKLIKLFASFRKVEIRNALKQILLGRDSGTSSTTRDKGFDHEIYYVTF